MSFQDLVMVDLGITLKMKQGLRREQVLLPLLYILLQCHRSPLFEPSITSTSPAWHSPFKMYPQLHVANRMITGRETAPL